VRCSLNSIISKEFLSRKLVTSGSVHLPRRSGPRSAAIYSISLSVLIEPLRTSSSAPSASNLRSFTWLKLKESIVRVSHLINSENLLGVIKEEHHSEKKCRIALCH